jgi:hypothetical protein
VTCSFVQISYDLDSLVGGPRRLNIVRQIIRIKPQDFLDRHITRRPDSCWITTKYPPLNQLGLGCRLLKLVDSGIFYALLRNAVYCTNGSITSIGSTSRSLLVSYHMLVDSFYLSDCHTKGSTSLPTDHCCSYYLVLYVLFRGIFATPIVYWSPIRHHSYDWTLPNERQPYSILTIV